MSTKNLARTVIEGGRYGHNKWERRNSSAEERVRARDFCKRAAVDPEFAEEADIEERQPVYKGFTDKLAPMYRWLDAQVDRPWSEVRSEVFQNFDTRTTAGRHITFDHLLREVVDTESGFDEHGRIVDPNIPKEEGERRGYWSVASYYVDQGGIFRKASDRRRRYKYPRLVTEAEYVVAGNWLNGRMVMEDVGRLYWVTPNDGIWMASWIEPGLSLQSYPPAKLAYYLWDNGDHEVKSFSKVPGYTEYVITHKAHGNFWNKVENPFSFRQRGELNEEESQFFKDMPFRIREDILSFTKNR